MIKLFVDYTLATAQRPQPIFAVTTALCVIGTLAGRRYRGPTDLRTNLYLIDVGRSGASKDHPRKCAIQALNRAKLDRFLGGSKIASGSGLISALTRQPSLLFQFDEFGKFLTQVAQKSVPRHKAEIWDNLTELFTSASSTFLGSEYADQKERPRQIIEQPNCVIHGSTEPKRLWEALQSGNLSDGSYARFLFFLTDDPIPDYNDDASSIADVPIALIDSLNQIVAGAKGWVHGNLADTANGDPNPIMVPYDDGARRLFVDFRNELTRQQRNAAEDSPRHALLARILEHTIKIALTKAISTNPEAPVITETAIAWAKEIVDYSTATMMRDAERFVADNDFEAKFKRVAEIIRSGGVQGITKRDFMRRTSFIDGRTLGDIVARLRDSEQIECLEKKTAGRPSTIWRWKGRK